MQTGNTTPEHFIATIRDSFKDAEYVYLNGSCFEFYKILKCVFPDAEPYYDAVTCHIFTKIGSGYYDIRGRIRPTLEVCDPLRNRPDTVRKIHRWRP